MSISGLVKASWFNTQDGVVAQANQIVGEGEFYRRAIETEDRSTLGEAPYAGDESFCELLVYDMAIVEQLEQWQRDRTRVQMVAAGVQQNIQWYEDTLIKVVKQFPTGAGRRNKVRVQMERKGHGAHNIYDNVNLLAHVGWKDTDLDELPDGYSTFGFTAKAFTDDGSPSSGIFEGFHALSGSSALLYTAVDFPIAGAQVKFSVRQEQLHVDGTNTLYMTSRDATGAQLEADELILSSTGRHSIKTTTPAQTYSITLYAARVKNATIQTAKVKMADPALRVDGLDTYVTY